MGVVTFKCLVTLLICELVNEGGRLANEGREQERVVRRFKIDTCKIHIIMHVPTL